ncbi:MAG: DUF192 family protein [Parcubacteria group bacterium Gr01-1014_20]|nr:MAG: DUF192 family protein [Parcubacteria group bacterium Gr01-1014_20]
MRNRKLIWSLITIVVLVVVGGWFFGFKGKANLGKGEVRINDQTFSVDVADTMMSRSQGLSGREKLEDSEGMFFVFDSPGNHGFWMKDMKFAIDIIWIKGERIVGFQENAKPEPEKSVFGLKTYYPPEAVDRVLEVNAGTVAKYGFKVGDSVYLNK